MKLTDEFTGKESILEKEDKFYELFLDNAIAFVDKPEIKSDDIHFKRLVTAAGVIAKQKQNRISAQGLTYQILRDSSNKILTVEDVKLLLPSGKD